jgi:hypothetical protein
MVRSRNHCCRGKAISITHYECVFVALLTQHPMRTRHIFIFGLSSSTIFFHIIAQSAQLLVKKKGLLKNVRFDFLQKFCMKNFSFSEFCGILS